MRSFELELPSIAVPGSGPSRIRPALPDAQEDVVHASSAYACRRWGAV